MPILIALLYIGSLRSLLKFMDCSPQIFLDLIESKLQNKTLELSPLGRIGLVLFGEKSIQGCCVDK